MKKIPIEREKSDARISSSEREEARPEGKIIDASFVEAPKQRNTREENERINVQINKYQPQLIASMG